MIRTLKQLRRMRIPFPHPRPSSSVVRIIFRRRRRCRRKKERPSRTHPEGPQGEFLYPRGLLNLVLSRAKGRSTTAT
jgi:hypothetical protein